MTPRLPDRGSCRLPVSIDNRQPTIEVLAGTFAQVRAAFSVVTPIVRASDESAALTSALRGEVGAHRRRMHDRRDPARRQHVAASLLHDHDRRVRPRLPALRHDASFIARCFVSLYGISLRITVHEGREIGVALLPSRAAARQRAIPRRPGPRRCPKTTEQVSEGGLLTAWPARCTTSKGPIQ